MDIWHFSVTIELPIDFSFLFCSPTKHWLWTEQHKSESYCLDYWCAKSVNKTLHQNRNLHAARLFMSKHACAVSLSGSVWVFMFTPAMHTMHIHDFYLCVCDSPELMSLIRTRSKRTSTKNVGTDMNQTLLSADLLNILFAISHFNQCSLELKPHWMKQAFSMNSWVGWNWNVAFVWAVVLASFLFSFFFFMCVQLLA